MDNDLVGIFDALQRARTILLLPNAYPTREEVESLATLGRALELNEKTVTFLLPFSLRNAFPETFLWPRGLQEELAPAQDVTITLDTERHPVHALRYEQEGGLLRIALHADQPLPKPEDFVISASQGERFESTVVIGAPNLDLIPKRSDLEPTLTESTLINIDTDPANERFGDLNAIVDKGSLRATVRQLIGLFPAAPSEPEERQEEPARSPRSLPELRMLGRMLARLTERRGVWTSVLNENDFEQSGLSHEQFIGALRQLPLGESFFPKPYAALWSAATIRCVIVGDDKRFYARLSRRIAGAYVFEGYHCSFETGNTEQALMQVRELLS